MVVFTIIRCNDSAQDKSLGTPVNLLPAKNINYAKRFFVSEGKDYKVLYLFGSKNINDTTSVFILYKNKKPEVRFKNSYFIKIPVKNVASLSSIYTAMISELGLQEKIVAIESVDYYNNEFIIQRVRSGIVKEIAKGPEMNIEQTIQLNPELIMMFGMGNPKQDVPAKILESGIPVAICLDHLEQHPLARAEWIKFIALFFGEENRADSLFGLTQKKYLKNKSICDSVKIRPTVLTEIKYSDAWYVPGGKSFMAHLLNDAGTDYIWKNEPQAGSIPLNFEQVYGLAKDADLWINLFININSKKDLLSFDTRYNLFKAFKNDKLYNNTLKVNQYGFSDYWERGMVHPDEILLDLIKIAHPELAAEHSLMYYKKIQ